MSPYQRAHAVSIAIAPVSVTRRADARSNCLELPHGLASPLERVAGRRPDVLRSAGPASVRWQPPRPVRAVRRDRMNRGTLDAITEGGW